LLYDRVTSQLDCEREPFECSGGVHYVVGENKGLFCVFAIGLRITNECNFVVLISTFPTSLKSSPGRSSIDVFKVTVNF
jgi:hypothetical protein